MTSITSGTYNGGIGVPSGSKLFYAKGLWWMFYSNGTNLCYATNSTAACTPSSFSAANIIQSGGSNVASTKGYDAQVTSDGNYVYYIYAPALGNAMYFRRGLLNSDGTITWSSDHVNTNITGTFKVSSIALDSTNHILVGFYNNQVAKVARNSRTDSLWTTDSAYGTTGLTISDDASTDAWCKVVPLTNNKWYAIYGTVVGGNLFGKLWTGSALASTTSEQCTYQTASYTMRFSATAIGDDVYLAWNGNSPTSNYNLYYNKRTYGAGTPWGTTRIQMWVSDVSSLAGYGPIPAITSNPYQNKLYVAWLGTPTTNHVFYRIYDVKTDTWTPLLSSAGTDAATEAGFGDASYIVVTSREANNRIVWLYPTTSASSYAVSGISVASQGPSSIATGPTGGCSYGGVMVY